MHGKNTLKLAVAGMALLALVSCGPKEKKAAAGPENVSESFGAYKHVVILGVDGGGYFFKDAASVRVNEIFKDGATTYRAKTSYPTISAQCWGSMLHGVLPEFHRLTNGILSSQPYDPESPYPSIFRITREAMPDAQMASICNWNPINLGIVENNLGVFEDTGKDPEVADKVVNYIENYNPTLLFVQFDSVDGAGHGFGYGSPEHLASIDAVDEMIGRIYDALKAKGILDETLIIVCADHGGTPERSHGGNTDAERYVFCGVAGKTVVKGGQIQDGEVRDVAAIAAYALGLEKPATWTGIVPTGVFEGVEAAERKEMELPVSENRTHKTKKTPALKKVKSLLDGHDVIAYLPLDKDEKDAFGKVETVSNGKLYHHDAYFGSGVDFSDGYVTLKDVSFGKESFSVAFWLKTNGVSDDPAIISNKDWSQGSHDGFVLSLREADIKFNVGRDEGRIRRDLEVPLLPDYKEGWMHVILVVDRKENKVKVYYDFSLEAVTQIPDSFKDVPFDGLELNIGQDGTGKYGKSLSAQIDEMIITADVLDADDIAAMKAFYK